MENRVCNQECGRRVKTKQNIDTYPTGGAIGDRSSNLVKLIDAERVSRREVEGTERSLSGLGRFGLGLGLAREGELGPRLPEAGDDDVQILGGELQRVSAEKLCDVRH